MKCQRCNQNEANTHITKIINGVKTEVYLCNHCAEKSQEMVDFKMGFDHDVENFFSGFLGGTYLGSAQKKSMGQQKRCEDCGMGIDELMKKGRPGCSSCYKTFADVLMRPLKQIHGANRHIGKLPQRAGEGLRKASEIEKLNSKLNKAVMEQNFEYAAELRDKIKELKNSQEG